MFGMVFIGMVLEESHSCNCYNNDIHVFYYARGVSFADNISNVGSKSLSPKGFSVRVLFWGLGVVFDVHSTNVHFPNVEDWGCSYNQPKVQLFNTRWIAIFGI